MSGCLPKGLAQWPDQLGSSTPQQARAASEHRLPACKEEKAARRSYCRSLSPAKRLSVDDWLAARRGH